MLLPGVARICAAIAIQALRNAMEHGLVGIHTLETKIGSIIVACCCNLPMWIWFCGSIHTVCFSFFSKWMNCRDGESRQRWLRDVCVLSFVSCPNSENNRRDWYWKIISVRRWLWCDFSFVAGDRSSLLCENLTIIKEKKYVFWLCPCCPKDKLFFLWFSRPFPLVIETRSQHDKTKKNMNTFHNTSRKQSNAHVSPPFLFPWNLPAVISCKVANGNGKTTMWWRSNGPARARPENQVQSMGRVMF